MSQKLVEGLGKYTKSPIGIHSSMIEYVCSSGNEYNIEYPEKIQYRHDRPYQEHGSYRRLAAVGGA